ncbi:hypothetical protein [Nitrososphaera sp.]|uniref:hypothetical protein n=1 Tax=Nitrososphaera sp. TaxID=1971748 RepID=UPI002EDBA2AF
MSNTYVGTRIDPSIKEKIQARCTSLGCRESDYFRRLLAQDLQTVEQPSRVEKEIMTIPARTAQKGIVKGIIP